MSPARSIFFGIARRIPPPNTSWKILNTRIVFGSAKQVPHTTVERIIFPQSNLLTRFDSTTSCHGPVIIRTVFLNQHRTYREAVFLTRLVKAEIVSPLLQDSHQYGRG